MENAESEEEFGEEGEEDEADCALQCVQDSEEAEESYSPDAPAPCVDRYAQLEKCRQTDCACIEGTSGNACTQIMKCGEAD